MIRKPSKTQVYSLGIQLLFASTLMTSTSCGTKKSDSASENTDCPASKTTLVGDACFVRDTALNITNTSAKDGTKSHNTGQNCMQCHQPRGGGRGIYTLAGSIFKTDGTPAANAKVTLYSDGAKTKTVASIDADGLGNFYTTTALPFPKEALFVKIESSDGQKSKSMPFPTLSGACNVCHTGGSKLKLPN
jgi:hypothetical protein